MKTKDLFFVILISLFFNSCAKKYPIFDYNLPYGYLQHKKDTSDITLKNEIPILYASNESGLNLENKNVAIKNAITKIDNDQSSHFAIDKAKIGNVNQIRVENSIGSNEKLNTTNFNKNHPLGKKSKTKKLYKIPYRQNTKNNDIKEHNFKRTDTMQSKELTKGGFWFSVKMAFWFSLLSLFSLLLAFFLTEGFTLPLVFIGWGGAFVLFLLIALLYQAGS